MEKSVNEAWNDLKRIFGPNVHNNMMELEKRTQIYANAIIESEDEERMKILGKRHLQLASERKLKKKQLDVFLNHAIIMESKK